MVKKFLSVVAISSMVFATSCSNEDFDSPEVGGESLVSFTAQLPEGINSRADYGDGTTAQKLDYAVYEFDGTNWTNLTSLNGDKTINLRTNVDLRLVNGKTYKVVFWASAGVENLYTFDKGAATITANYDDISSNDEKLDAFYAVEEITVTEASSQTVELHRPFAQLNIGTADLDKAKAAGLDITAAGITVAAHKGFSFKTQDVTDEATTVTFGMGNLPTDQDFPVDGYKYLTMNYLFMPATDTELVDVTLNYGGATTATYSNVPLKRNYRTNIYGNLTTSVEDFTVVIEPEFDGTHLTPVWDGEEMVEPAVVDNAYQISSAAEWAWVVAHGNNTYGAVLTNDINFYGHSAKQMTDLNGTFDGQGHTMSNLVVKTFFPNSTYGLGIFSGDATGINCVKNVTFKNITVENTDPCGVAERDIHGFAGVIFGDVQENKTFENVTVDGCYVKGVVSVGGLAGFLAADATLTIKNCKVINSTITNYDVADESGFVAGLLGRNAHETIDGESVTSGLFLEGTIVSQGNTINGVYAERRGATSIADVIGNLNETALTAAYTGASFTINNNLTATAQITADVVIRSVTDLQAFRTNVANGQTYAGKTIALASDLNLEGVEFHSIGVKLNEGGSSHTAFKGTFDGHGYTLKNMSINEETATGADCATGFFSWLNGGEIKNLNFENANVTGNHGVGTVVGYLQFGTVRNCKVNGSTVTSKYYNSDRDGDKAGGAIGIIAPNATAKCDECIVTNSHIYAMRDAGQVIGAAYNATFSNASVTHCRAENVTVTKLEGGSGANLRQEIIGLDM